MSDLDDISAPLVPVAPQVQAPVTSLLDEFSTPLRGSTAKARATVNANENPEDAGKALSISKQTGIPASIVQTDLPGYDAHAKTEAAARAVQNPAVAKYIDDNPMASKVSNDDYSILDKISGVFKGLGQSELDQAVTFDLARQVPGLGNMMGTQPGREKFRGFMDRASQGFTGGFGEKSEVTRILQEAKDAGLSQNVIDFWQGMGLIPAARAFEGAMRIPGGIIGGLAGFGAGAYEAGFGNVAKADRLQRDLNIFGTGLLIESGQVQPKIGKPVGDLHTFLAEHTPGGPRDLSAGETPKDQLWQAKPIIDQVKADTAGEAIDSAVEAAQESKTKERSPELFEKYLEAHGDKGTVYIPAQVILDLYEKAGKVPMDGDGLFGFVPGITDKATLAAETGAEVKIPLSKYIAHVDESVHEGLKDQVRVQENGVTREEAKVTSNQAPVEEVKSTQPIPEDNPVAEAAVKKAIQEKKSLYLEPLFTDASALNITAPEFKRYSDLIDRSQEQVLTKAVALAKREASKRLTPEWRANEATERAAVEQEIYDSPAFAADRFFNTDKGLLPNGKKILSDFWKPLGEVKADEWAPVFGFESGTEMSTAILRLEQERADAGKGPKWQMKQHVDAETSARMEAKYGHLADNIAIEASEAALAEYNVDLLATEWKMLAKLNGREPPLARDELTSWAKDQFDKSTASEVSYETWRRAAEKGGRETEKALLKKDFEEAFNQKQKQMLAFLLAREAKGFEKEVSRAENLFSKYQSEVNLPAVDQAYTDQIHRQLQQFGIETKRTVENTDYNLQGKDFDGFVRDKNANGDMIVKADLPRKSIDQLTVNEYRDLATMIKSLDHNGRAAMKIEMAGKKEAFNEVIDKIAKNLDTLEKNDFDPTARGPISGLRAVGRAVDSRLLKAEKLIDWIDKKDPLGAFNSSVLRGLIEGEQGKGDMITKLAKMAGELPGDRAWGKALNDATTNHELLDLMGKPMQLSNENKIAIALNYGNKSNRKILLEGYKWKEHEVEAYLAREMTDMDKAVVDGIHGLFEPLAPLVEKATSSRAGVAIPLIEGSPHNGMKGGYYPLMEDPRSKLLGQQVDTDLFQKTKFDPLPTANALKQRTGKVYPLDLSISQIHARLSQTAHAVFMQDPVINANKVISDPIVREGIDKAFGPEYVRMLDKWIRDIADNGGSDVGFHDDMATWLSRNLRQNVTVQLMGWKASTALIHGGSAGASSIYELGKMDMDTTGNATKSFVTSPARLVQEISRLGLGQFLPNAARRFFGSQSNVFDAVDFVQQNSGEMRNRQRSLQKDFGYQLDKIYNSSLLDDAAKLRAIHQTYSMAMVAYLDQLTATPVWKAAYDKATVADGMEHADAVYVADKAVREAHGSASLVSRANIGRGEINKWLTIAYNGYWNHNYNKMREAGREVAGYDDSLSNGQRVAIGAAFMTAMIVAPALVHHAVRGEEAKTTGGAIAGMLVSQFGGTVPLVNTLTYSMIHNRDPSISPLDEVLKAMSNVVKDRMAANPKHTEKHAAQAFGYLTGLPPTNQAIDTFSFMNDVMHRQQDPKTVQEWARGLMTGHALPKVK